MVIVEGDHDAGLLSALLVASDERVADLVANRRLVFESSGSASKISTRVIAANSILSTAIVVVDGDEAGRRESAKLIDSGLIESARVVQLTRAHAQNTELEDMFAYSSYGDVLEDKLGFSLNGREKRVLENGKNAAWSERLKKLLESRGLAQPDRSVVEVKGAINASLIAEVVRGKLATRDEFRPQLDRLSQLITNSAFGR